MLVVDDFVIEYVRNQEADHLASVLKKHHDISQDWEGKKFADIDLDWNYETKHCDRTCRQSMKNYIKILLVKLNHTMPRKPQLSHQKFREVKHSSKNHLAQKRTHPSLSMTQEFVKYSLSPIDRRETMII